MASLTGGFFLLCLLITVSFSALPNSFTGKDWLELCIMDADTDAVSSETIKATLEETPDNTINEIINLQDDESKQTCLMIGCLKGKTAQVLTLLKVTDFDSDF